MMQNVRFRVEVDENVDEVWLVGNIPELGDGDVGKARTMSRCGMSGKTSAVAGRSFEEQMMIFPKVAQSVGYKYLARIGEQLFWEDRIMSRKIGNNNLEKPKFHGRREISFEGADEGFTCPMSNGTPQAKRKRIEGKQPPYQAMTPQVTTFNIEDVRKRVEASMLEKIQALLPESVAEIVDAKLAEKEETWEAPTNMANSLSSTSRQGGKTPQIRLPRGFGWLFQDLQEQIESRFEQVTEDSARLQKRVEAFEKEQACHRGKEDKHQKDLEHLQIEHTNATKKLESLQTESTDWKSQIEELRSENEALRGQLSEVETWKGETSEGIEAKLENFKDSNKADLDALRAELKENYASSCSLRNFKALCEKDTSAFQHTLESLRAAQEDNLQQHNRFEGKFLELRRELDQKACKEDLQRILERCEQVIAGLRQQLHDIQKKTQDTAQQLHDEQQKQKPFFQSVKSWFGLDQSEGKGMLDAELKTIKKDLEELKESLRGIDKACTQEQKDRKASENKAISQMKSVMSDYKQLLGSVNQLKGKLGGVDFEILKEMQHKFSAKEIDETKKDEQSPMSDGDEPMPGCSEPETPASTSTVQAVQGAVEEQPAQSSMPSPASISTPTTSAAQQAAFPEEPISTPKSPSASPSCSPSPPPSSTPAATPMPDIPAPSPTPAQSPTSTPTPFSAATAGTASAARAATTRTVGGTQPTSSSFSWTGSTPMSRLFRTSSMETTDMYSLPTEDDLKAEGLDSTQAVAVRKLLADVMKDLKTARDAWVIVVIADVSTVTDCRTRRLRRARRRM